MIKPSVVPISLILTIASVLCYSFFFGSFPKDQGYSFSAASPFGVNQISNKDCKGRDLAVFFAAKDYEQEDNLKNPIRDAVKIAAALYDNYNFDTIIVRNPKKDSINKWIYHELRKRNYEDQQLLLFFSGHGKFIESKDRGYFLPIEAEKHDTLDVNSYVSFADLRDQINLIPAKHILVLIDACFSGAFLMAKGDAIKTPEEIMEEIDRKRPGTIDKRCVFIQESMKKRTRQAISSAGLELSPDGIDHSPFAGGILNRLATKGKNDRILTIYEIMDRLQKIKPKPQLGYFKGEELESNFLFVHKEDAVPVSPDEEDTVDSIYITDQRDYQHYRTLTFVANRDTTNWMVENVNYNDFTGTSWNYKNDLWRGEKYGRLYTWEKAQKVCPEGWRLPTAKEWEQLALRNGGYSDHSQKNREKVRNPKVAYAQLTRTGFDYFYANLGGYRTTDGGFNGIDKEGIYWTGTEDKSNPANAYAFRFKGNKNEKKINLIKGSFPKVNAFSCRCVKK